MKKQSQSRIMPHQSSQHANSIIKTQVPRNYSAESNALLKYGNHNEYEDTAATTLSRQHRSRRPKSNQSVERNQFSNQQQQHQHGSLYNSNNSNSEKLLYSELSRAQSINFSTINSNNDDDNNSYNNDDENEAYEKQFRSYPTKKILKYTRGKSLENFDYPSPAENPYGNPYDSHVLQQQQQQQHRYCQNCSHNQHHHHHHQQQSQQPFTSNKQYSQPYQQQQQQTFIPRVSSFFYSLQSDFLGVY